MKASWQEKKLGELAELKGRIGWRGLTAKEYTKSGPLFLSVHSLNYGDYVDFRDAFHISEERYYESPEIMLQEDDVLICKDGAGIGKVGILGALPDRATINSSLLLIRSGKSILPKFLYHCLSSPYFQKIVNSRLNGATTPHLYQRDIIEFPVILPPLPEQEKIVAILDEAFDCIATAKANAEKNLQNAKTLFESHLQAVFNQRGGEWLEELVGSFCDVKHGFAFDSEEFSNNVPHGKPIVITPGNFTEDGRLLFNAKNTKRFSGIPPVGFCFDIGDMVVVMTDLSSKMKILGKPALVETENVLHNQRIGRVVFLNDKIEKRFLYYFMLSEGFLRSIKESATGTMVRHTAPKRILNNLLPFPRDLKVQQAIVAKLDALREETQRLESIYQQKLVALGELRKSLLHKAFSGELTEQWRRSNIIPFPTRIPDISTTDLHAGILAIAYDVHEKKGNVKHFGHVKAEKMAHMVEAYVAIELGRTPVKDAAGPNDFSHLKRVEHRAEKAGYFKFQRVKGAGYRVTKYSRFDELIKQTRDKLGNQNQEIDRLLELMLPMDTQQAEVVCTVFAAWNNLLLDSQQPTDENIVFEARENWHPAKLNIPREKFFTAIEWLKEKGIVPTGKGKKVMAKAH